MSTRESDHISSAQQTLESGFPSALEHVQQMSELLNTQLDRETLATCVGMIEHGANPEALAAVIQELRRESSALNAQPAAVGGTR